MNKTRYPIRVVTERTGLKPDLIRMWERRYQAVEPERSPTGRRLYTEQEITRLTLLRQAVDGGWRISDVSARSDDELAELVGGHRQDRMSKRVSDCKVVSLTDDNETTLLTCLAAIKDLDIVQLEQLLNAAEARYGMVAVLDDLVSPLLIEVGRRWERGDIKLGQEHMVSAVLRRFLDTANARQQDSARELTLLSTTPTGQNHELGALMTAATASSCGWNSVYMNPNTPAMDIAWTADAVNARVVALSIVYPAIDNLLHSELHHLASLLPPDRYLLIGGPTTGHYQDLLEKHDNCAFLNSQRELSAYLERIKQKSEIRGVSA